MDFWKSIGRLLRHRFVGPPIIMLSIGLASLASALVPLSYQSTAFLVLTTPPTGGSQPTDPTKSPSLTNPLLQFNDGLRTTTAILIHSLGAPNAQRELGVVEGGPTTLTIDDGRSNPDLLGTEGPFIYIEGYSRSATEARDVVVRAADRIRGELIERQQALRAPLSTYIGVVDVTPPSSPEPVIAEKLQAGGIALVGGIVVGLSLAYGIDRWVAGRRSRRLARAEPEPAPELVESAPSPRAGDQRTPQAAEPDDPRVPISLR